MVEVCGPPGLCADLESDVAAAQDSGHDMENWAPPRVRDTQEETEKCNGVGFPISKPSV